jgi:hypothetical protein
LVQDLGNLFGVENEQVQFTEVAVLKGQPCEVCGKVRAHLMSPIKLMISWFLLPLASEDGQYDIVERSDTEKGRKEKNQPANETPPLQAPSGDG